MGEWQKLIPEEQVGVSVRPREPSTLLGLELLRFASAIAVLMFHFSHFARMSGVAEISRPQQPGYSLLWPLYDYGQFGVQVFWGISGYIFFWKYGSAVHRGAVSARKFFWLRFSRLYPLHVATLFLVIGLQAIHRQIAGGDFIFTAQDGPTFVRQIFMATDWGPQPPFSFNGPIWSVSAEVAVYAGFFLLVRRSAPSAKLCAGVIMAGLALQLAGVNWVSIACATFFFAGGLAALAPKDHFSRRAAWVALTAASILAIVLADRDKLPMLLLVAVPSLLILMASDWCWRDRWQRPVRTLGNLTYSSYLLHFPLQLILAISVAATGYAPPLSSGWFLLAYLGITLAAAAISYRRFELPMQQWIRRKAL